MKIIAIGLCLFVVVCFAGGPVDWEGRTIYQLLTDRFSRSNGDNSGCASLSNYCGGTWDGVIDHLDYIQGMGFDAIWISPVPVNYQGGYHGYWQTDMENLNPNFGTPADLQNLITQCHKRGIYVMVDVVANHVGPVGYTYNTIVPFNQPGYYHDCTQCPSGCSISDWNDLQQMELCRLAGLPDLNQTVPFVHDYLVNWVNQLVSNYSIDGLRIDTVPEVAKDFWADYVNSAGVYTVGEVFNGDVGFVSGYQAPQGPLGGVLSYPLFFTLRSVFANQQSMYNLQSTNQAYQSNFGSAWNFVGTFLDNHDNARFLNEQGDYWLYKNALVYTLLSEGIPIIYYGTEQGYAGGNDPNNRETLWTSNFDTTSQLYEFLTQVIAYRKQAQVWNYPQVQRYADDSFYAFTRGTTFVATTNGGSNQGEISRTITYHPYSDGTKLCNLFYPTTDCITVQNGQFVVDLLHGECKIYYPSQ